MASIVASLPPPLLAQGRKTLVRAFPKLPVSPIRVAPEVRGRSSTVRIRLTEIKRRSVINLALRRLKYGRTEPESRGIATRCPKSSAVALQQDRQNHVYVAVKATGDNSESSTSLSITKSVQNIWDNSGDRLALIGLGLAAIVAIRTSANLVSAIDKLPVIPTVLEVVGILFSSWFIYRYLLFKPDREVLFQIFNKTTSEILGK